MPKRKSITGATQRKQAALRDRERRQQETEQEAELRRQRRVTAYHERHSQETEDDAENRRQILAARERERRNRETEKEAQIRRQRAAERDRERILQETEEEAENRRERAAERDRDRRIRETEEEAENRRERAAERDRDRRIRETEEEAENRRQRAAERIRERRIQETEEEAENRRQREAERIHNRRIQETEEEAEDRRQREAERIRERRIQETEEEAENRRQREAERDRDRRIRETEEEADQRRRSMIDRHRLQIESETLQPIQVRENRLRQNAQRRRNNAMYNTGRCGLHPSVEEHSCGEMNQECNKCGSLYFGAEKNTRGIYSSCCHNGKVLPEEIPPYPEEIKGLMDGSDPLSAHFKDNIRSYNSALSFSSMGAQIVPPPGSGPFCFRIHGQIYHRTSHLRTNVEGQESYAQLYVLDSDMALHQRMNRRENYNCKPELMAKFDEVIRRVNPYAQAYKMLREVEEEVAEAEGCEVAQNVRMYITENSDSKGHKGRYNAPRSNEIAMVFKSSDGVPPSNRDICIYPKGEELVKLSPLSGHCDPMAYVIFFPCGERGWSVDKGCSELQFYSQRISVRKDIFNPILRGGKLFQQYIVDSYVKVEANRLQYLRLNQKTLRVESYLGLADHLNNVAEEAGVKAGVPVILPSTFIGSPRAMQQNFQDAMAIVREFGKPDLFLTFTCNPKWKEIQDNLLPGQKAHDRPDLVARVFDIKKKALLEDLKKNYILGRTIADIHVIEFQKRGLPHMHLLLILSEEDKIRDEDCIDQIVCAELPDAGSESILHNIVKATMIHGPCGVLNPNSPCMIDGVCSKGYPKKFNESTVENVDGYPVYRRRDNGNHIVLKGNVIDNRWVVPYNSFLSKKYNAHINVEICSSVKSIKYIFKYVYKGHDCAKIEFKDNGEGSISWDEIKSYLDARYVSAPEGMWRLLEKSMQDKSHTIIRLPVHLPDMQPVYFMDEGEQQAFERASRKNSMLTAWFELNTRDPEAHHFKYTEIPKHYVWNRNNSSLWQRRVHLGDYIVSRMYSVSPKDIERYHLRLLLCHVKGAKSFQELLTYENITYQSFKDVCRGRNLLEDDGEWHNCLNEACVFQMPSKLRQLFSFICVFCSPNSPLQLWEDFKVQLSEDFARCTTEEESYKEALWSINAHLKNHNLTLQKIGLPQPIGSAGPDNRREYDTENEKQEGQRLEEMLNSEQRLIFENVMQAVQDEDINACKAFSVNAFAGSGKSFLFNAIIHTVRGMGHVAVPVAWTGIASILLDGGRTVHSRFKLPVPVLDNSTCNIRLNEDEAKLLRSSKIIIWDECTMTPHYALGAVDRFLREVTGVEVPFGGKVFVIGGDWRQILPVAVHSNRTSIIERCLKNSPLWSSFKCFTLVKNMRMKEEEKEFGEWLLQLGDGRLKNDCGLEEDIIEIPPECVAQEKLVEEIFGYPQIDMDSLADRAILCPKNEDSLKINEEVLKNVQGDVKTYYSADSIVCEDEEEQNNFQMDFINKLTPSGMPPHELNLKVGVIIMLLRNMDASLGLCNGTRLIVKNLMSNFIDAEVVTGHARGSRVFIPRITLMPSDTNLPFQLKRRQFPIRLSFAMTINKAQGQSLKKVGIYLPQPVFSHGMLYVAFSRCTEKRSVRVWIKDTSKQGRLIPTSTKLFTKNVVFHEVLR